MRTTRRKVRWQRRGSALPLVMLMVVIILITGTGMLSLSLHTKLLAVRSVSDIKARSAADAALAKAVFEMNEKLKVKPWDDSSLPEESSETLPNSDAIFSYTVTDNSDGTYTVDAIGRCGRTHKQITTTLTPQSSNRDLFGQAILAQRNVDVKNTSLVDAYNSDNGPYGGANSGQDTTIATNSTQSQAVEVDASSTLYGDIELGSTIELPGVSPPTGGVFDADKGDIEGSTVLNSGDSGRYEDINITNGQKLIIDGDVTLYVTEDFLLDNASEMEIRQDSSLTLYLSGDFTVKNESQVNNLTEIPKNCQIYSVSDQRESFLLDDSGDFHGTIYAPECDVEVANETNLHGIVIADNVLIDDSSQLHYDAALAEANLVIGHIDTTFVLQHWREE